MSVANRFAGTLTLAVFALVMSAISVISAISAVSATTLFAQLPIPVPGQNNGGGAPGQREGQGQRGGQRGAPAAATAPIEE